MSEAKSFKCPSCGSTLNVQGQATEIKCEYCGNIVSVPQEFRGGTQINPANVISISDANGQIIVSQGDTQQVFTVPETPTLISAATGKWMRNWVWGLVIFIIIVTVVPIVCSVCGIGASFVPFFFK